MMYLCLKMYLNDCVPLWLIACYCQEVGAVQKLEPFADKRIAQNVNATQHWSVLLTAVQIFT